MQVANANPPIRVTGRHISVTDAIKDYATKKIEGLHLDFPKIIEAQVILDVQKYRHQAEIILFCANHITIEASEETEDMYTSIDAVINKIARQMRKYKTRFQRHHRPKQMHIREFDEQVYNVETFHEDEPESEPAVLHTEKYHVKPMFVDEAILQLEMSSKQFLVFLNPKSDKINILYRRKNGHLGLIEPDFG